MSCVTRRLVSFGLALPFVVVLAGCHSFPSFHRNNCQTCGQNQCGGCCETGCQSCCADECKPPKRYSDEWWAIKADEPVGARQKCCKGKMWPPYPRPTGKPQQFWHKYHASHYWPHPYDCQDRHYVREVLALQSTNGWIAETTLYGYHFDIESNELTDSGKMHLQWILEHVPDGHRMAWVETAMNSDVSQQRLDSVRDNAIAMVGEENAPPVMLRVTSPLGRPALEVDVIRRAEIESIPEPRIAYEALPSGSGGGGN